MIIPIFIFSNYGTCSAVQQKKRRGKGIGITGARSSHKPHMPITSKVLRICATGGTNGLWPAILKRRAVGSPTWDLIATDHGSIIRAIDYRCADRKKKVGELKGNIGAIR